MGIDVVVVVEQRNACLCWLLYVIYDEKVENVGIR